MISFLKRKIKIVLILTILVVLTICIFLFGRPYFQKQSLENKLDKNKIERCISREANNCNSKKKICKLYDKKETKECENEFNKCVKMSTSKCKENYNSNK